MESDRPDASDATDKCRQRYLASLAALYRREQELALRVDALPFGRIPALDRAVTVTRRFG